MIGRPILLYSQCEIWKASPLSTAISLMPSYPIGRREDMPLVRKRGIFLKVVRLE
jgi:hypothetical protein